MTLPVEVVYLPKTGEIFQQWLMLTPGATVADALAASGLYQGYPEAQAYAVGIFGQVCTRDQCLSSGDRVEIYRPLLIDPKEKRRNLACYKGYVEIPSKY